MTTSRSGTPPGQQNGRPQPRNGRPNAHSTSTTHSVQARADETAFRDGYGLGFGTGWHVGYRHAYHEQDQADRRRMAYIHGLVDLPAYTALERVRWDGKRTDFGRPRPGDHPGGPVDWETGRPRTAQGVA